MALQALDPSYPQVGNNPGTTAFDPFNVGGGGPVQTGRLRAYVKIIISGMPAIGVDGPLDITSALEPYLLSVRVRDGIVNGYGAEIELDDRDARLPIPPIGATVDIEMGWLGEGSYKVYEGQVQDVEHGFARKEGGRKMWIHCGPDQLSKGKDPQQNHTGDGAEPGQQEGKPVKLMDALQKAASAAGHSIALAPKLQSLTRDYVAQANESFYHFGNRIADEIGGFFRVVGGTKGEINTTQEMASGAQPTVIAQWGYNLISWRVKPLAARPAWGGNNQQYFDTLKGQWKLFAGKTGLPDPWGFASSVFQLPRPAANASNAQQDNDGTTASIMAGQGPGRIVINGEPRAHGGGHVVLIGARPGVDGTYWIEMAEHLYSREGYVTWLDVYVQVNAGGAYAMNGTVYQTATREQPAQPTTVQTVTVPGPGQSAVAPQTFSIAPVPGPGESSTFTPPPATPTPPTAEVSVGEVTSGSPENMPTPAVPPVTNYPGGTPP
jgi:hypothetical protein